MQTQSIVLTALLAPLLAVLSGCQPPPPRATGTDRISRTAAPTMQQSAPGSAAAPSASTADAMKLAQDIGCFACHAIEKKLLGPAWKTVAQINRDVPDAKARLMNKISKGGSGVWGRSRCRLIRISRKRKRTLVKFILSLE